MQAQAAASGRDGLTVKTRKATREVIATYERDEAVLEIRVNLPDSFPLRGAVVESTRHQGVRAPQMRAWLLASNACLMQGGGSVAQAVLQWAECAERRFEGVEECPICYSIVHATNGSLPRLACRTCKHKLHAECLYQWFKSSHKSTCPLCQTTFY